MVNMIDLPPDQERALGELAARLHAAGYEAPRLRPILGRGILDITPELVPGLIRCCQDEGSPAARLVAFWLLLQPVRRSDLDLLLGCEVVRALEALHLVEEEEDRLRARASLYPLLGHYFLADPVLPTGSPRDLPWLASPGYALVLATPWGRGERALDLHTGPGVHAVLHATHYQRSWGLPESPRAREFCRLNARINGLDGRCHFVDAPSLLPPTPFDRITGRMPAAPPSAGEDMAIIRDLGKRLDTGGTLVLAVRHFTPDGPLLERVERWLGGGAGWGLAHLCHGSDALDGSLGSYGASSEELFLGASGFEAAAESLLFIRRLAPGHPGWRVTAPFRRPQDSVAGLVGDWLDAQDCFSDGDGRPARPEWRPQWSHADRLYVDPASGLGVAHYPHGFLPRALDSTSTFVLDQVDGHKTTSDLVEVCATRWQQPLETTRAEVVRRLGELGRLALIR